MKHDCKDRWGQTPLTEAIQFKHTKVAAILKRYDRSKQLKDRKGKLALVGINYFFKIENSATFISFISYDSHIEFTILGQRRTWGSFMEING